MCCWRSRWTENSAMRPIFLLLAVTSAIARPVDLRCDYLTNPLGIDNAQPRLSWRSDSLERDWRQGAYQILVATTMSTLAQGKADVWDSGKQSSAESIGIPYGGPSLSGLRRYYWTVRVWDAQGRMATPAEEAWWEMGPSASDWKAKWISREDAEEAADRASIQWIRVARQHPTDRVGLPPETADVFNFYFEISRLPMTAALYFAARGRVKAVVNGHPAGSKNRFRSFDRQDITDLLVNGRNSVEIAVTPERDGTGPRPAALAALIKLTQLDGSVERYATGTNWHARLEVDSSFPYAVAIGDLSDPQLGDPGPLPASASLFRRAFTITKPLRGARLYATALGSYRLFLNGERVGADALTPEYTDYAKRVTYQTYDVTRLLRQGNNAAAAILGDGWFGSGLTWAGLRFSFLPAPTRLLAQLRLDYADGSSETLATDETWKTTAAPILHSEIYSGEVYDSRLEQKGWDQAGFDDSRWNRAMVSNAADAEPGIISGAVTLPPRVVETMHPRGIREAGQGKWIADMGQNMVGWLKISVNGPPGERVRLRFAEILAPDGSLYTENLRNANATDILYLRGGPQIWSPMFTFHGFRYVEISGLGAKPQVGDLTGEVVSSVDTLTGKLTTSSALVNRMWKVGVWGQRSNFLSIPTDCPQRDERLGWMGDAEVFWRTGSYNADIAAFGHKWLRDVIDDQTKEGAFGNTSPGVALLGPGFALGAPGWGDAGVIVPWTAWQQFGDQAIVQNSWDAMQRWMQFIEEGNPNHIRAKRVGPDFSDWLAPDNRTPKGLVATAYWALQADMMSQMARAIGKEPEAKRYADLFAAIRTAFQKEYVREDGTVGTGTETSYVLALHMKLLPDSLRAAAVDKLVQEIAARGGHVSTGFLGTPHLLFALADNGRTDVAYRLLLNETYPSWGYMLDKGATTWWERWNSDSGDPSMNSFNHYAFGSVVAWVYRYVAGIDTAMDGPGFRQIVIHPRTEGPITQARGEYDSVYGKIVSDWKVNSDGSLILRVSIPANTRASVHLPTKGKLTEDHKAVQAQIAQDGTRVVTVGAGAYEFRVE